MASWSKAKASYVATAAILKPLPGLLAAARLTKRLRATLSDNCWRWKSLLPMIGLVTKEQKKRHTGYILQVGRAYLNGDNRWRNTQAAIA